MNNYSTASPRSLIWTFFLLIFIATQSSAQIDESIYDGPYIFKSNDSIRIQWVENGIAYDSIVMESAATVFDREGLPVVDLKNLSFEKEKESTYSDVKNVVALSDVHGQYDILINLLKANDVIDDSLHWSYGEGHMVIVGDNFDRGDKVLDILWFLFYLQKEAAQAGGKLHVLIGNHELMVLNRDLRYLHEKHRYTAIQFKTPYNEFFREGSVLGDWIANHNVIVSINKKLYVHGGISPALIQLDYSLEKLNSVFRENILRKEDEEIKSDRIVNFISQVQGPLWYRGYFLDSLVTKSVVKDILDKYDQKQIIVGHTSFDSISVFFDGKVIAVDCSIKNGITGQLLIHEGKDTYVADIYGDKHNLFIPGKKKKKKSLFRSIYEMEGEPKITITTDVGRMIGKRSKEEYQVSSFQLSDASGKEIFILPSELRSRGNMRKKVCRIPPIKVDFTKSELDSLGYAKVDKLKFVLPCRDREFDFRKLYREYLLYDIYRLIDSNSIRAKLVDLKLIEEEEEKKSFKAFIVEDEGAYARRKKAIVVTRGKLSPMSLERTEFLKMTFFQYMISNTDWSIGSKHNIEMVKLPENLRVTALPYDFDYSGFVGQPYAVPHASLPIDDVHERYFFSFQVTEGEFNSMVKYYKSMKKPIYQVINEASYMEEKEKEKCQKYIESFFKMLEKPKGLKRDVVRK